VAVETFNRDQRFAGGLLAGGLAFRFFLWLLPFSLVVVVLLGNFATMLEKPASYIAERAGLSAALAGTVAKAVDASGEGRWYLLVVGVFFMLWAGMGVVKAGRLISGLAWGVPPKMNLNPLASSAMVVVVISAVFASHLMAASLQEGPFGRDVLVVIAEAAILVSISTWVFWNLPHAGEARLWAMLPGAALVTVGVYFTRLITSIYFAGRLDRIDDLYGALGIASVFLAWLFIIARLWVAGASLNAASHLASEPRPSADTPDG
jgi:uncharacterized BrkB/YihY/UPF0761 family membrane protein